MGRSRKEHLLGLMGAEASESQDRTSQKREIPRFLPFGIEETRKTIPLENKICPKCGVLGQEKLRRRGFSNGTICWYVYFDHYEHPKGMNNYHRKYERSCYIGKVNL